MSTTKTKPKPTTKAQPKRQPARYGSMTITKGQRAFWSTVERGGEG